MESTSASSSSAFERMKYFLDETINYVDVNKCFPLSEIRLVRETGVKMLIQSFKTGFDPVAFRISVLKIPKPSEDVIQAAFCDEPELALELCRSDEQFYGVLDGMHRVRAYRRLMATDHKWQRNVFASVYDFKDRFGEPDLKSLILEYSKMKNEVAISNIKSSFLDEVFFLHKLGEDVYDWNNSNSKARKDICAEIKNRYLGTFH